MASNRKDAQFKVGQVVEVAASGWGLAPALIGKHCTITSVHRFTDKVTYKVKGLEGGPDLVSNDIWEQSFKALPLTKGELAQKIYDRMDEIRLTIDRLDREWESCKTELVALAG